MKVARWAPLSGVVFVALWVVALFLTFGNPGDSDREILSWYADSGNRDKQMAGLFVIFAASLVFVWFLSVLRGRLANAEGRAGTLTAMAFGGGLVAAALWMVSNVFFSAFSIAVGDSDKFVVDPNTYRVVSDIGWVIFVSGTMTALLVVLSTALLSLKGQIVPRWIAWISIVVAALMVVSFFFVPFLVFLGWVLVVSLWLTWKPGSDAPPVAASS